ncbi:hypothetical protein ASG01_03100 [Chryseobacterium sp. Leaf180]|jgi:hypothetical protein|uniref:hypothetical protein n=1 Tax=Chryseobacterium sp. Leaf180 TaxID=1736289 RepID=UPI0006F371C7|nr:hypothetical protein [Chryseobacterium sp. Leaf180]KQR94868.1 hypothetical protein ASG01_03100 [Chryseobacterium sp. Leaf180]
MERIRIKPTAAGIEGGNGAQSTMISELKSFLQKADNKSFDQIKMRQDAVNGKIVVDCVTGIKYPEFDEFIAKVKSSKFGNLLLF